MENPLLMSFSLPPFSKIQPKHLVPAVTKALENCRTTVEEIVSKGRSPYTWDNLCQKLAEADDILERILSPVSHLNLVKNSLEMRKEYEKVLLLLSEYNTWISQNKRLYRAYRDLRNSKYYDALNTEQKKAVNNTLRDFFLSGINLPKKKKKRYAEITMKLSELSNLYNNNVLDATMGWWKLINNKDELTGIPKIALTELKKRAEEKGWNGYLLTLDQSSYQMVMTYCDNRDVREELYRAYITRASDQGPNAGKWDNSLVMVEILSLRHELARLLGFENYANKSLVTKMAKNTKEVLVFLNNLSDLFLPHGKKEIERLNSFTMEKFGVREIQPWDFSYYSEKQKEHLYGISNEQFRPYFPENKIIEGLFYVIKRIYGISIVERHDIDVWDPEVRFFELRDENNNKLRGSFYLDLYSRENKQGGAWMGECINKMRKENGFLQNPVAYLTCNFNRPINGNPALFTHDEVSTLFHEFGHVLHHTLTSIETVGVSGISGIPWDAIELSSQLMENWCWEADALLLISGHYKTGESLPKSFLNKLLSVKNYQSSIFILRQLTLSLLDFRLHSEFNLESKIGILETLTEIEQKTSVISQPKWGRIPHSFTHIFSGAYAAGYYSYLWSNVLAADAFSRFKEKGIFSREIGQSFLDNILSKGGSEEPIELFRRFRGRNPELDAMLKHFGIEN